MRTSGAPLRGSGIGRNVFACTTIVQLHARLALCGNDVERRRGTGRWLAGQLAVMGPTYIKLGQFIKSRADVYGEEFSSAFGSMLGTSPANGKRAAGGIISAMSCAEAESVIKRSVDTNLFDSICYDAMSVASIAQVHRARMRDGRDVVIKIMRPGIRDDIAGDLAFMSQLVDCYERIVSSTPMFRSPSAMAASRQARESLADLTGYLAEETDLQHEAANLAQFAAMYPLDHPHVRVPRPVLEACSRDALVMEDVPSRTLAEHVSSLTVSSSDGGRHRRRRNGGGGGGGETTTRRRRRHHNKHDGGASKDANTAAVAQQLMSVFLRQLVSNGVVHGDPHEGNLGIDAHGRLVMYDFGSVVRFARDDVCHVKDLVIALLTGNSRMAISVLRLMGAEVLDEAALTDYLHDYREYMRTLDVRALMESTRKRQETSSSKLPLVLPGRVSRIVRSFALLEGICKSIDPGFNYFDAMASASGEAGLLAAVFDSDYVAYKLRHDSVRTEQQVLRAVFDSVDHWLSGGEF